MTRKYVYTAVIGDHEPHSFMPLSCDDALERQGFCTWDKRKSFLGYDHGEEGNEGSEGKHPSSPQRMAPRSSRRLPAN